VASSTGSVRFGPELAATVFVEVKPLIGKLAAAGPHEGGPRIASDG